MALDKAGYIIYLGEGSITTVNIHLGTEEAQGWLSQYEKEIERAEWAEIEPKPKWKGILPQVLITLGKGRELLWHISTINVMNHPTLGSRELEAFYCFGWQSSDKEVYVKIRTSDGIVQQVFTELEGEENGSNS